MSEKKSKVEYKGRKKIYTDVRAIGRDNVISVLCDSLTTHMSNRSQIDFLVNYEKGDQFLPRQKEINSKIDIHCVSNLAHRGAEFYQSYVWGNHMAFVQKSDKHPSKESASDDDSGVSLFNEMLEMEDMDSKDQKLAYYVEVVGVCPQLVDIKRDYVDGEAGFDLVTLNPRYAYVVYSSDAYERPMMGVSYSEDDNGDRLFSCITNDSVFIVKNLTEIVNGIPQEKWELQGNGQKNPFGMVNIIECERAIDRTGVFERQIDQMNALNVLESDAVNNVAQTVQAVWWGSDIEFKLDEEGNPVKPVDGQWMLTKSNPNSNQKPDIKPLVMPLDYQGVLADIESKREEILENMFVPILKDQSGGSTTGATSLSSGWAVAEAVACKESNLIKSFYRKRNKLMLIAIKSQTDIPQELRNLTVADIDIRPIRQKTFDMATKVNSLATMVNTMVHPRHALEAIDFFPNLAETVEDSVDMMLRYQEKMCKEEVKEEVVQDEGEDEVKRIMSDSSDQVDNSPLSDL